MVQASPSLLQSTVCTVLLISLSVVTLPFTASILVLSLLYSHSFCRQQSTDVEHRKTVLLTGARNVKCLILARAFHAAGHRVIVAEEPGWFALNPTRFSRCVTSNVRLPDPANSPRQYKRTLRFLVRSERVDMFIPCSSPSFTVEDAEAAREMVLEDRWTGEAFIQDPIHVSQLHWKHEFIALCDELRMLTPETHLVSSVDEAVATLHHPSRANKGIKFITKSLVFDDRARTDMTPLPLSTVAKTAAHLRTLPLLISPKTQYLLQQRLHGYEYCTHAAVRDGTLVAFVCCPSSDMLMRYVDVQSVHVAPDTDGIATKEHEALRARERAVGEQAEEWTRTFLARWKEKLAREAWGGAPLTGHFCIDFILDESGILYPIECNPRAHTAVAIFSGTPNLAAHYLGTASHCARPPANVAPQSWIGQALPLSIASLLPKSIASAIHPLLASTSHREHYATLSPQPSRSSVLSVLADYLLVGMEEDPTFDIHDPVPFFVLLHLQWPWLLIRQLWAGKAWSRVNISTSRIWGA
ncbi:hypothetical protein HGRIS_013472 [Hohenbuehelia grisea]|uniref:ATP-grasp domain-containing protein n=1 Tax=Hohenbuehelia grisea TaxID=104357 RepID=A0ABR3IVU7_9AGAR